MSRLLPGRFIENRSCEDHGMPCLGKRVDHGAHVHGCAFAAENRNTEIWTEIQDFHRHMPRVYFAAQQLRTISETRSSPVNLTASLEPQGFSSIKLSITSSNSRWG